MTRATTRTIVGSMLGASAAVALGIAASAQAQPQEAATTEPAQHPKVDDKAEEVLRQMSDYMSGLRTFTVTADSVTEVVTEEGQKLAFGATSNIAVERPNKLRADRKGDVANLSLFYDGKEMSLLGRKVNMYATAAAPPTLDAAIDFGRESLSLEAPGADLLYSNPYEMLMENVVSGRYLGTSELRGRTCHHLAFRNAETDWQLWVADGPAPLPCKYVITSKQVPHEPQFSVVLRDWNTQPELPAGWFDFQPPKGATEIDFFGERTRRPMKGTRGR